MNSQKNYNIRYAIHWTVQDKRRLYWLIDQYLKGRINADTFCDDYFQMYVLTIDPNSLSELEGEAFRLLSDVAGRFSPFEEDLRDPGAHYSEAELRAKMIETKQVLAEQFATYEQDLECC